MGHCGDPSGEPPRIWRPVLFCSVLFLHWTATQGQPTKSPHEDDTVLFLHWTATQGQPTKSPHEDDTVLFFSHTGLPHMDSPLFKNTCRAASHGRPQFKTIHSNSPFPNSQFNSCQFNFMHQ